MLVFRFVSACDQHRAYTGTFTINFKEGHNFVSHTDNNFRVILTHSLPAI